jgi:pimeloyl-ACP methyl ester carboxylesterase
MNELESGSLDCLGTGIAYHRRRGAGRPLLLIHGISDDGLCWKSLIPSLDPSWDVVMADLRGHGRSDAPDSGWNLRTMADEMAALVSGLGMESPFIVGQSIGAAVALALAAYHPEIPCALFLEDPVPLWKAPAADPEDLGAGLASWLMSNKRKTYADLTAEVKANSPLWDQAEHGPWIDAKHRMSPKAIQIATARDLVPPDFKDALAGVRAPLFILSAEIERGAICPDADIDLLRIILPGLQSLRLQRAGHCIGRDSPGPYRKALMDFFRQVEARSPVQRSNA